MDVKNKFYKIFIIPFVLSILYIYISTLINIYVANSVSKIFNLAIASKQKEILIESVSFIVIFVIIKVMQKLFSIYIDGEKYHKKCELKVFLYDSFQNNRLRHIEKFSKGEILNRFDSDQDKLISILFDAKSLVIATIISFITYFVYLTNINWIITFIIILLTLINFLPSLLVKKKIMNAAEHQEKENDKMVSFISQTFEGIDVIKLNNIYKFQEKKYYNLQKNVYYKGMDLIKNLTYQRSMTGVTKNLSQFGLYGVLAIAVFNNIIDVSIVVKILILSKGMVKDINTIFDNYINLKKGDIYLKRINELVDSIEEECGSYNHIDSIESIEIKNLNFLYDSKKLFNGLNFKINKGEKVAILGENGCGKSTLIKILLGLYDDYEGEIFVNGQPLKDVNLESYKKFISWMPQEAYFYGDYVQENLNMNNLDGDLDQYIKALELDNMQIKNKLCEELSGGQQQKISLIRAVMKDSEVLIIDEPTNHLDEKAIQYMKEFVKNSDKTIVAVTHNSDFIDIFNKVIKIG